MATTAQNRRYYLKHRERILVQARTFYQEHKRRALVYSKNRYIKRRKKALAYAMEYRKEHPMQECNLRFRFGTVENYMEAMRKYDGWCAFACDKKSELVHHLDGKSSYNSFKQDINNNLQNLLPLCRSCHGWLHTRQYAIRGLRFGEITIKEI